MNKIFEAFKSGALRLKDDKLRFLLFVIYTVFTVFSSVYFFVLGRFRNGLLPIAYAALFIVLLVLFEYFFGMRCGNLFLIVLFSVPVGGILGTCYEFYMYIPFFDTLLHTISGFIFAVLGYTLMMRLLGDSEGMHFYANLIFGIAFSLGLATLWELFEWMLTVLMNGDMLEDTVVYNIRSYLLSGTHNQTVDILDIEKTVIYYDGGKVYTIEGYLDLGGLDSLVDMAVCLAGTVAFTILSFFGKKSGRGALEYIIPKMDNVKDA